MDFLGGLFESNVRVAASWLLVGQSAGPDMGLFQSLLRSLDEQDQSVNVH